MHTSFVDTHSFTACSTLLQNSSPRGGDGKITRPCSLAWSYRCGDLHLAGPLRPGDETGRLPEALFLPSLVWRKPMQRQTRPCGRPGATAKRFQIRSTCPTTPARAELRSTTTTSMRVAGSAKSADRDILLPTFPLNRDDEQEHSTGTHSWPVGLHSTVLFWWCRRVPDCKQSRGK